MDDTLRRIWNSRMEVRHPVQGVSPTDSSFYLALSHSIQLAVLGYILYIPLLFWLNLKFLVLVNLGCSAAFALLWFINRRGRLQSVLLFGAAIVAIHTLIAVRLTGWEAGFHYYLTGLVMLIFLASGISRRIKVSLALLLALFYIALFSLTRLINPLAALTPGQAYVTALANICVAFIMFGSLGYFYRVATDSAETELRDANQALALLARTDPLTRLWNRRTMLECIETQVRAYELSGRPFALVLADVDDFKAFNDRFGHECGDRVLTHLAELMRASLREEDRLSRWGGEEFLALLPGAELDEGGRIAERLRLAVADAVLNIGGQAAGVTMTFGVCCFKGGQDVLSCIRQADKALYVGKHRGRNCVISVESPGGD